MYKVLFIDILQEIVHCYKLLYNLTLSCKEVKELRFSMHQDDVMVKTPSAFYAVTLGT